MEYLTAMNPARKRTVRLIVALSAAVLLASALIYTSFSAASPALTPSQLRPPGAAGPQLPADRHGRARLGAPRRQKCCDFSVADRAGGAAVAVSLHAAPCPIPFREGREVIVTVAEAGRRAFVGERDSLITKCPSKYKDAPAERSRA